MANAVQTPLGHSLPPSGPHTITFHLPGWETAMKFKDGDTAVMADLKSIYPRFLPWGVSAELLRDVGKQVGMPPGHALVAFLSPDVWQSAKEHATSAFRSDKQLSDDELQYRVVDVAEIRLYLICFPSAKQTAAIFMWQHGGLIFSTRLADHLLPQVETSLKDLGEVPNRGSGSPAPPPPTYLPEVASHGRLRERIAALLGRACADEPAKPVRPDDVYLYQTGMAAIVRFHEAVMRCSHAPAAVFGAVFHSTWHLFEESPGGLKHYGRADDKDMDEFESYLEGSGKISYVFTEFPSNPILVSVDLARLRRLADKYGFWILVDDTVASFCNIDLLPAVDAIVTSLTKSFSGYADVMAGSIVLNPNMASYSTLKPIFTENHHNELFAGDADQLLQNSDDYLARSITLNHNARAVTQYLHSLAEDPKYPVSQVWYPPYAPGSQNLTPFLRKPTPDYPDIGYGCLFSVELESQAATIAFYDNLAFHQGPHLGAHLTIAMPYNAVIYGRADADADYHAAYGLRPNQIRFSVGLEPAEQLLDVCKRAVTAMMEAGTQVAEGASLSAEMV